MRAARAIRIRAGLHAGEVYEAGGRLFGICINIAARVAAQAGADDVFATELVAGLVEELTPCGEFHLKGVGVCRLVRRAS